MLQDLGRFDWPQTDIVAIPEHDLIPAKALPAEKLHDSTVEETFAEDATLLVDTLMDVQASLLIHAVDREQRATRTEAPEIVLSAFSLMPDHRTSTSPSDSTTSESEHRGRRYGSSACSTNRAAC